MSEYEDSQDKLDRMLRRLLLTDPWQTFVIEDTLILKTHCDGIIQLDRDGVAVHVWEIDRRANRRIVKFRAVLEHSLEFLDFATDEQGVELISDLLALSDKILRYTEPEENF